MQEGCTCGRKRGREEEEERGRRRRRRHTHYKENHHYTPLRQQTTESNMPTIHHTTTLHEETTNIYPSFSWREGRRGRALLLLASYKMWHMLHIIYYYMEETMLGFYWPFRECLLPELNKQQCILEGRRKICGF